MSDGAGPLTKKIGGQPAWIWIVVVVGFVVGVQWYRGQAARATAGALVPSSMPTVNDPAVMGSGVLPQGAGTPTPQPGPTMSTADWLAAAMKAVKNAGEDPLHASRALNAFLNGGDLTYADTLVVNAAVDAVGVPPGYANLPPGNWQERPLPAPTPTIKRLVNPAGNAGIFAEYTDGTIRWIPDMPAFNSIVNTLKAQGVSTSIFSLPASDPIWQNADVVKTKSQQYKNAEIYSRTQVPGLSNATLYANW